MDVSIINPFLVSAIKLFDEMFKIKASPGTPFIMENFLGHRWEISALLGITGEAKGVVAIRLHQLLVDHLLVVSGIAVADDDERREVSDAMVGEFVNIISGNAIGLLDSYDLEISVPITVQGANHRIAWPRIAPVICIPFHTVSGDFEVDVCFKA